MQIKFNWYSTMQRLQDVLSEADIYLNEYQVENWILPDGKMVVEISDFKMRELIPITEVLINSGLDDCDFINIERVQDPYSFLYKLRSVIDEIEEAS